MKVLRFAALLLAQACLVTAPVAAETTAAAPAPAATQAATPADPAATAAKATTPVILNRAALPADMTPPQGVVSEAKPAPATTNPKPVEAQAAVETPPKASAQGEAPAQAPTPAAGDTATTAAAAAPPPAPAPPSLHIDVNLTTQRMTVSEDGKQKYSWAISSGRQGYRTPTGTFRPAWMSKMWYSRQYDYAPMPHSIFFSGGTAIHATYATGMLGRPASHGCVRLSPSNAATLYKMVARHGKSMTRIAVHGAPSYREPAIARNKMKAPRYAALPPGYRYAPGYAPGGYSYGYRSPYGGRPVTVYRNYTTPRAAYGKPRRYVQRGYYTSYPY